MRAEDRARARRHFVQFFDENRAGFAQLFDYVLVVDDFLADVDRRTVRSSAIFTTSIALTTPAQKPRGLSRKIFLSAP